MYGMPLAQALVFLACGRRHHRRMQWRHFHPFLCDRGRRRGFRLRCRFSHLAYLGSVFGSGFSETIYSPGLVIVAASVIAGLAEGTSAVGSAHGDFIARRRICAGNRLAAIVGLIAGLGASPASAFALLTPLLPADRRKSGARAQAPLDAGAGDFGKPRLSPF